ncbi:MAG: NUDIX hydrolase [Burkholderiales bacterium]|nr:NUDIX hydrolase [Burkholderiales bacterium]
MAERDLTETTLTSDLRYRGRMLQVREDRVRLPDGGESGREYVVHPGAAVILPLFDDGTVLLERQFRYPVRMHCLELPAGKLDAGEAPLTTAKRELLEETGYEASDWQRLCTLHPCIGYSDEAIELFVARGLVRRGDQQLDAEEFLETLIVPLTDALAWVRDGRITDVKTIIGLFWAERLPLR